LAEAGHPGRGNVPKGFHVHRRSIFMKIGMVD
jgi:hypothetical protein